MKSCLYLAKTINKRVGIISLIASYVCTVCVWDFLRSISTKGARDHFVCSTGKKIRWNTLLNAVHINQLQIFAHSPQYVNIDLNSFLTPQSVLLPNIWKRWCILTAELTVNELYLSWMDSIVNNNERICEAFITFAQAKLEVSSIPPHQGLWK